MRLLKNKGFSLVELLAVVAILGTLAAIAIPLYNNHRATAFRSAAQAALMQGGQNMERFFVRNNTYVGATIGDPAADPPAQVLRWPEGRRYELTFQNPGNDAVAGPPTQDRFVLRATPQSAEPRCGWLQIDQRGNRTSELCGNW